MNFYQRLIPAKLIAIIALILIGQHTASFAEENLWIYTRGTDTRPKGSYEFKLSMISRIGKSSGHYRFDDIRPEIEYGITNRLTLGAEILLFNHDYKINDPDLNPMYETQANHGGSFKKLQYAGFEIFAKYNILSPYKDYFGLSVYAAYEYRGKYRLDGSDIDQDSYVLSALLQKNFYDDKLTLAANLKTEFEYRKSPGILEEEFALDFSTGASYRFAPKHFLGIEFRHQSDYLSPYNTETQSYEEPSLTPTNFNLVNFRIGTQHQNGNYLGLTYHYAEQKWWVTTGVLFQIFGGGSQFAYVKDHKNYDEHETVHIGLIFGYNF